MALEATLGSSALTKKHRLELTRVQLENERASFIPHWRDLGDNILPYRVRLHTSQANKGDRKNQKIIDSTATLALRTLRAGMMGGITSPARPWFRLTTPDPDLAEFSAVKEWLHVVTQRMLTVFLRSNLYNALPIVYGDLGAFGTGALVLEEDKDEVIRLVALPIGSYMLAVDSRGRVNTFIRVFSQTVRQIVDRFAKRDERSGRPDWSNISTHVRGLWQNGNYDARIDVVHVVMPNSDYDPRMISSKFKRFSSCYYEAGGSGGGLAGIGESNYMSADSEREKFLRESGFDYFPVLAPRWEITGDDAYGSTCPGMDALGDIRQLQAGERRIQEAIEKLIRPPMKGHPDLLNMEKSILPGGFTSDPTREQNGFRPVFEIDPRIQEMEHKQEQVRGRIKRAFYEDVFMMFADIDRSGVTATEISAKQEERLIVLGPVLEQLGQDLHSPLIDNTFLLMHQNGMLPPAPEEIQGMPLKVEYISIMAQAQKLLGVGGMERYAGFIGNLAKIDPNVVHKANFDQLADEYAEAVGISPKVNRSDDEVAKIRDGIAKAEQARATIESVGQMAGAARDMSQASLDGENVLTEVMGGAGADALI